MPKLRFTANSPFARKVRVVAFEIGLQGLELVPTELRTDDASFWSDNPLAKVPVWIGDDGTRLFDSNVICAYLNDVYAGGRMLPAPGPARWQALTVVAVADGMAEAGMLARQEMGRAAGKNETRVAQEMAKVLRGLDRLDEKFARDVPAAFGLDAIAVACSLDWIALRFGLPFISEGRPHLAQWLAAVSGRESLVSTRPQAEA